MADDTLYRVLTSYLSGTLASAAGAAVSTGSIGAQTYAVELLSAGIVTSTGGVRYAIGEAPVATSTSAMLPFNWPLIRKVTPGQKISFLSNDAVIPAVTIVELTK